MFLKNLKKTFILLLALIIMPPSIYAYSDYIIASGENVGIELQSNGVMIVGLYKVGNTYPATEAGLEVGDVIVSINDQDVEKIDDLVNIVSNVKIDNVDVTYIRDNITKYTNLKLYKDNDITKTGLYIKDSVTGIGTLTFIDPNTKLFGALGHEVTNSVSGQKLEVKNGYIFPSKVTGIEPSIDGTPGEKNARYNSSSIIGTVSENTEHGVFGEYTSDINPSKLYKVATPDVIHKGSAKILTVLQDSNVEQFDINIIKINTNTKQTTKNILFEITDQKLLDQTGGIIQGMSGSPIIQDDYIIGAVTHVIVDNPKRGYGIFITNMLDEAEN